MAVAQFHRTDERRLLQQAIPTHAASEQWPLYAIFRELQSTVTQSFLSEWGIGGLPSSARSKTGHRYLKLSIMIRFDLKIDREQILISYTAHSNFVGYCSQ
jgi:hypothetical protein